MTIRDRLGFLLYRTALRLLGHDPACCVTVYSGRFNEFPAMSKFVREVGSLPFQPDDLGVLVCYRGATDTRLSEEMARAD